MNTEPTGLTHHNTPVSARHATVLVALGAGLVMGVFLDLLTVLVARYGIEGNGWSLRGNGALAVPFGLGPALLTAAWTALVLHARTRTDWLARGVAAGCVGAALVAASAVLPILLGSTGAAVAQVFLIASVAWMILAPVLAGFMRGHARSSGLHVAAGLAFTLALGIGFVLTSRVLAPGA